MTVSSLAFGFGAFLCGIRALGYWAILQIGGVQPGKSGGIALVMGCSALLYVILSAVPAYLQERRRGSRAVVVKTLFFIGAYGLAPVALFAGVSRGAILQMPEVVVLIVLFAGCVIAFRPRVPQRVG